MTKCAFVLLVVGLALPAASGAQEHSPPPASTMLGGAAAGQPQTCKSTNPAEVVVCGRSQQKYRIDPSVLAAERADEALPSKPALDASTDSSCTGPNCGGGTIPLVGMALVALKAAELAADGDDWREAFRAHPDTYRVYQDAKAKQTNQAHISVGVSAGNK
jgi:hypothetical protein